MFSSVSAERPWRLIQAPLKATPVARLPDHRRSPQRGGDSMIVGSRRAVWIAEDEFGTRRLQKRGRDCTTWKRHRRAQFGGNRAPKPFFFEMA